MTERIEHAAPRVIVREWKVRDYAKNEQVSERTVWTWIAKGAVEVRRTPGGGVRIVQRIRLH